jgi:hypothetical protein
MNSFHHTGGAGVQNQVLVLVARAHPVLQAPPPHLPIELLCPALLPISLRCNEVPSPSSDPFPSQAGSLRGVGIGCHQRRYLTLIPGSISSQEGQKTPVWRP